jgi:ankyrin repeat protein
MTGTSAGDRLLWSSVPSVVLLLCDESGSLWFYSHLTSRFGNYFTAIVCTELVRALVSIPDDQPEKSVHQRGDNGFTVLGRACMADGPESVKLLLDVGSNPTLMAYIPGSVCLMHVTHQLSTDSAGVVMIRLLIQYGAKLDTSDDEGLTTLTRAAARGNLQSPLPLSMVKLTSFASFCAAVLAKDLLLQ